MTSAFRFIDTLAQVQRALVDRFDPSRVAVPPELADAQGELRGEPLHVHVEALRGGPIAYARFATVQGPGLEIASLLCVPRPALALPILGADLVALGPRRGLVAIDLSPVVDAFAQRDLAALAARRTAAPQLASAGELPHWFAAIVSPHHVFARIEPDEADQARAVLHDFVECAAQLLDDATPRSDAYEPALAGMRRWMAAHRQDDKSVAVLAHAFGSQWAARLVDEVLFPEVS